MKLLLPGICRTAFGISRMKGPIIVKRLVFLFFFATAGSVAQAQTVPTNGLIQHLKADAINTNDANQVLWGAGNTYVTNWIDQSGQGNSAWQTYHGLDPLYITNACNGKPALRFNGAGQFMYFSPGARPYPNGTVVVVMKALTGSLSVFWQSAGAAADPEFRFFADGTVTLWTSANGYAYSGNPYGSLVEYGMLELNLTNGAPASMSRNQRDWIYSPPMTISSATADGNRIGTGNGGSYGNVEIAEIVMYDHVLSVSDRAQLTTYLTNKYSLASVAVGNLPIPALVPTNGLVQFLSADNIDTNNPDLVRTEGSTLYAVKWPDASSAHSDAFQNSSASQPLYITNAVNGRSALRFDGSDDWMDFYPYARCYPQGTVFMVMRTVSGSGGWWQTTRGGDNPEFRFYADGTVRLYTLANGYVFNGNAYGSLANYTILELNLTNGAYGTLVKNGGVPILTTSIMNMVENTPNGNYIGRTVGGSYGNVEVVALVMYNRLISDREHQSVGWYLANQYGIMTEYIRPSGGGMIFIFY